jgi:hypothetical protein
VAAGLAVRFGFCLFGNRYGRFGHQEGSHD